MPMATPEAQREYGRKWRAARRAKWMAGKSCVRCGSTEDLQIDHIDMKKKVRRWDHGVWSWSAVKREAELAKCQVLCKPCHKAKTIKDQWPEIKHGKKKAYERHGCRCQLCKDEMARLGRAYRARKKLRESIHHAA